MLRHVTASAFVLAGLLAIATSTSAAPGPWLPMGPDGGWVFSVQADPVDPATAYALAMAGGYKSIDGGASWTRLPADDLAVLAVAPSNTSILYGSTGFVPGDGHSAILKSIDGGGTWTEVANTGQIGETVVISLAVHPTNPDIAWAGTGGNGLLKTVDGGTTWTPSSTGITDDAIFPGTNGAAINDIAVDPAAPSTVYVATCCGTGLFKSTNGGASWSPSNTGLGAGNANRVVIDPATPATLYATAPNVFKSVDGGASWNPSNTGLPLGPDDIDIDPSTPSTLYAVIYDDGLYKTVDGGGGWSPVGCTNLAYPDVAVRGDGGVLVGAANILGNERGGVYVADGMGSCVLSSTGITSFMVNAFALDPLNPANIYMVDEQTAVFKTIDGGVSWSPASVGLSGIDLLVHAIAIDPVTPSTLFLTSGNGLNDRVYRSTDSAGSWSPVFGPALGLDTIATDPTVAGHVFTGTRRFELPASFLIPADVKYSNDGGTTWLDSNFSSPTNFVTAFAVDPTNPLVVYVGTEYGVDKSLDGGANFTIGSNGLPFGEPVVSIAIDPSNTQILYAAAAKSCCTPGGIFKSTDGGLNWSPRNTGLGTLYVSAVAVDPFAPSVVYAATLLAGIYRSDDGASTWTAANEGLYMIDVRKIATDPTIPGRVYAGTRGGSMFRRDFPAPCVGLPDGDPCNDDDPCTIGDECTAQVCNGTTPTCGDGAVAGCEQCDDGPANGTSASCCSATCTFVPAGTACDGDASLCTSDVCNATGSCTHPAAPDATCATPATRGGVLKIVNRIPVGVDRVKFKWSKGPAVPLGDFGAPNGATTYELCVYDTTPSGPTLAYRGRPQPPCTMSPCWKQLSAGWKFKSSGGPDGISDVLLRAGSTVGKARIQVKAKGDPLALPTPPLAKSPSVVAQLRTSDGACWGATFSTATKNDSHQFTARSD
jgi:photosystem II stability/assembly factor-like uncharacterized protein